MKENLISETRRIKEIMGIISEAPSIGPGWGELTKALQKLKSAGFTMSKELENSLTKILTNLSLSAKESDDLRAFLKSTEGATLIGGWKTEIAKLTDDFEKNLANSTLNKIEKFKNEKNVIVVGGHEAISSVDDLMRWAKTNGTIKVLLDKKKGGEELLKNWMEMNISFGVGEQQILSKLDTQISNLKALPDKAGWSSFLNIFKKGKDAPELIKGGLGWLAIIGVGGAIVGLWDVKTYLKNVLCRTNKSWEWLDCAAGEIKKDDKTKPEKETPKPAEPKKKKKVTI